LLRTGGEPPGHDAAEKNDEITPPHFTLSSTMARPKYQISLTTLWQMLRRKGALRP
jgi:hypothetical protein